MKRHPIEPPIERIAVFRALMLGDLLCAVPALRALRQGFPAARITLVGLSWARALAARLDCVDDFIEFPGAPGLPEVACDVRRLPGFLADMQSRRFDLAVQLQGSGGIVNPLVASFGARHCAGFADARAWVPPEDAGLFAPWPDTGHEIERLLALTDHLGLPRQGLALEFPITEADRDELRCLWPAASYERYVCVHAGSQLPSRRWDPCRFAEVADAISRRGRRVVLSGAGSEAALVAQVRTAMREPSVDLCGRTSLWTLGALVEGAEAVVCNDTGLSHIAAALRRPSVVVACGSDSRRWAPLDRRRHRVLAHQLPCRPCAHRVCPTGHECAAAVGAGTVIEQIDAHLDAHLDNRIDIHMDAHYGSQEASAPVGVSRHVECSFVAPPSPSESSHA
jgi:ADP-heptose:LPS heptosyltransferase